MKKNKAFLRELKTYLYAVACLIVLAGVILAATYWSKSEVTELRARESRPSIEDVKTLGGVVTKIKASCGARALDPADVTMADRICDSGSSITVNGMTIQTATGGPGPGFHAANKSVNPGDTVSVRYVVDEGSGGASLNCDRCSVTVVEAAAR